MDNHPDSQEPMEESMPSFMEMEGVDAGSSQQRHRSNQGQYGPLPDVVLSHQNMEADQLVPAIPVPSYQVDGSSISVQSLPIYQCATSHQGHEQSNLQQSPLQQLSQMSVPSAPKNSPTKYELQPSYQTPWQSSSQQSPSKYQSPPPYPVPAPSSCWQSPSKYQCPPSFQVPSPSTSRQSPLKYHSPPSHNVPRLSSQQSPLKYHSSRSHGMPGPSSQQSPLKYNSPPSHNAPGLPSQQSPLKYHSPSSLQVPRPTLHLSPPNYPNPPPYPVAGSSSSQQTSPNQFPPPYQVPGPSAARQSPLKYHSAPSYQVPGPTIAQQSPPQYKFQPPYQVAGPMGLQQSPSKYSCPPPYQVPGPSSQPPPSQYPGQPPYQVPGPLPTPQSPSQYQVPQNSGDAGMYSSVQGQRSGSSQGQSGDGMDVSRLEEEVHAQRIHLCDTFFNCLAVFKKNLNDWSNYYGPNPDYNQGLLKGLELCYQLDEAAAVCQRLCAVLEGVDQAMIDRYTGLLQHTRETIDRLVSINRTLAGSPPP